MIMAEERNLNNGSFALFKFNNRGDGTISKISEAQNWDWLSYLDDDYLTEYEVRRMKALHRWQLQELAG